MTTSKKVASYSDSDVLAILTGFESVETYEQQLSVAAEIGEQIGKTARQIMGKVQYLSRNGSEKSNGESLYIHREYTTKTGTKVIRKSEIVSQIASRLDVESDVIGSLESATKNALKLVLNGLS